MYQEISFRNIDLPEKCPRNGSGGFRYIAASVNDSIDKCKFWRISMNLLEIYVERVTRSFKARENGKLTLETLH